MLDQRPALPQKMMQFDILDFGRTKWIIGRMRYTAGLISNKSYEADVLQNKGKTVAEVVRQLGVNEMTC